MSKDLNYKTVFELVAIEKNTRNLFNKNVQAGSKEEFNEEFKIFVDEVPFSVWHYEIIPEKYPTEKEIILDHKSHCYLV